MYEAKNTIRLASVEFDRSKRSNYARSKAASPIASAGASRRKSKIGFFDDPKDIISLIIQFNNIL
jgi:hypothetical protein